MITYDAPKNQLKFLLRDFVKTEQWALYSLSPTEILMQKGIYNIENQTITEVFVPTSFPPMSEVYRFFKGKENQIWAVAQNGLYVFKDKKWIDYYGMEAKDAAHKLAITPIYDAYEDKNGIFWIVGRRRFVSLGQKKTRSEAICFGRRFAVEYCGAH